MRRGRAVPLAAATAPAAPAATGAAPGAAALWMTGAVASFSLMAVAGRELSGKLDTFEIMLYRSALGFALVAGVGWATGRLAALSLAGIRLHLLRNVLHFTGQNLWFLAVGLIPLAQLFALEFTTPIWVALLAPLVLAETMTRARAAAALAGFLGILLVARPGVTPVEFGHVVAALTAVFFAGSFLTTKMLSRSATTFTILFWMTGMQAVMGLMTAGFDGDIAWPRGIVALWVMAVGVCGLSAHLCITMALHRAPASVVAPMDFARLPLIAVVGMVLYGEPLEVAVLAGGLLILAGNMINIRAERHRSRLGGAP